MKSCLRKRKLFIRRVRRENICDKNYRKTCFALLYSAPNLCVIVYARNFRADFVGLYTRKIERALCPALSCQDGSTPVPKRLCVLFEHLNNPVINRTTRAGSRVQNN